MLTSFRHLSLMMQQHDADDPRHTSAHRPFILTAHRSLFTLALVPAPVKNILDLVSDIRMGSAIVTAAATTTKRVSASVVLWSKRATHSMKYQILREKIRSVRCQDKKTKKVGRGGDGHCVHGQEDDAARDHRRIVHGVLRYRQIRRQRE